MPSRWLRRNPGVDSYARNLASCYEYLADLLEDRTGLRNDKVNLYRKALELRTDLLRQSPSSIEERHSLAGAYNNAGLASYAIGAVSEAVEYYNQAISLSEQLVRSYPTVNKYAAFLANHYTNLAHAQLAQKYAGGR